MTDEQGAPSRGEREAVAERIRRLSAQGQINPADRDIRLGNVENAASRSELDLMSRDLDQLEAALPVAPQDAPAGEVPESGSPYSAFHPGGPPTTDGPSVEVRGSRRGLVVVAVVVALLLLLGAVAGLIAAVSGDDSSSGDSALPPAETSSPGQSESSKPERKPQVGDVAGGYSLSEKGVTAFLDAYRRKFRTTKTVDMVMYPDYAVVDVPVRGGRGRQRSWLYRNDSGWTTAGAVRAVFPGSGVVETRQLDVPALMRNIAVARRTLRVEKPTQNYVVLRFLRQVDDQPLASIYVSNNFGESGYLATRLGGRVVRAYPYGG